MGRRNYPRLGLVEFGHQLLESGDLDPVYTALPTSVGDRSQLHRWLVAYWCFYSCGFACWASEWKGEEFWAALLSAAINDPLYPTPYGGRWPRGHERRHARGKQGIDMVACLGKRYGDRLEGMVEAVEEAAPNYAEVSARVQEHVLFGPWIAFKVADMLERVVRKQVDFTEAAIFMFNTPRRAAHMFWEAELSRTRNASVDDPVPLVVEFLVEEFKGYKAPPWGDRPIGLQEVETILCKWKSHSGGHYPLLNDIDEIREGTTPWARHCTTARRFLDALPEGTRPAGALF